MTEVAMRFGSAALTMIAALGPVRAQAQQRITAFENVAVIPMDRERVLTGQTVVVERGRIVAMGPAEQVRVPTNAVRIDGHGKFLMPGLADMHMHLGMGITKVKDAEQILFLLLANGVTTIRNLDYNDGPRTLKLNEALRLRARVATGDLWGPRIYTAGKWYTDTTKSVAQNVEAYKAAGYDLIKVHTAYEIPRSKLDSLVEAARRVGIPIAGHPVGGLAYALQHHYASLEHLEGFPAGYPPPQDFSPADTSKIAAAVAETRQAGVRITPTLGTTEAWSGMKVNPHYYEGKRYLPAGFPNYYSLYSYADTVATANRASTMASDTLLASLAEVAAVRCRLILALQNAGVELLLGTDSPLLVPGYGVHQELDALVRAGLTPYQALVTGTRNVAAYFGTLDSVGTVAVGKRADLVLLTDNPLTNIRHAEKIAGVMAAGRWLPAADIERRLTEYAKVATKTGRD